MAKPTKVVVGLVVFVQKLFSKKYRPKHFDPKKILVQKICCYKIFVGQKEFVVKKVKRIGYKNCWSKNIWVKRSFVQKNLVHKNQDPKKLGPKSFVKIGSVTSEIMLIWTNDAKTYVARANVTMTVRIC